MSTFKHSQHVAILRAARERIEDGREKYVCAALMLEGDDGILQGWVRGLLDGASTLEGWLFRFHLGVFSIVEYAPRMRLTRLAWLDWMIEEWSRS